MLFISPQSNFLSFMKTNLMFFVAVFKFYIQPDCCKRNVARLLSSLSYRD